MTGRTGLGNGRVVKTAIGRQRQKTGSVVTIAAFRGCCDVMSGFPGGYDTIVAAAAFAEYFVVINEGGNVKTKSCMTSLAHITGCYVIS